MKYVEMLARMGISSAHPGGFASTLKLIGEARFPYGTSILEAGCGTGRTACFLAKTGCRVTGLDLRPDMIDKASRRAIAENVSVDWVTGDIQALPFPERSFDVVLAESATNFADAEKAVSEYGRVLREGGTLYCREVVRLRELGATGTRELCDFFGFKQLYSVDEWLAVMEKCGFIDLRLQDPLRLAESMSGESERLYPDPFPADRDAGPWDTEVWESQLRYVDLASRYGDVLGSAVCIGSKAAH